MDDTDIILNIDYGRQLFDFAIIEVIRDAMEQALQELGQGGNRVLHDSEIPWHLYRAGLLITATTPGRGPRILTWEVLATSLRGLYQCGYQERKHREMYTSIWDMHGNFYGDLSLQNRSPHATQ